MSNSATNMDSQTRDWLLSQLSVMDSSSKDKSLASSAMQLEPERIVQLLDEVEVSHRERLLTILCEWTFDPVLHASSEIMDLCVAMFVHFNLLERYKVDERVMRSFLANIAKEYNSDIPYHNFTHAVDAAQFLFLQLEVGGAAQFLNYQDIFALLIAALAHDVGHNGRNNQFHIGQRCVTREDICGRKGFFEVFEGCLRYLWCFLRHLWSFMTFLWSFWAFHEQF